MVMELATERLSSAYNWFFVINGTIFQVATMGENVLVESVKRLNQLGAVCCIAILSIPVYVKHQLQSQDGV